MNIFRNTRNTVTPRYTVTNPPHTHPGLKPALPSFY
jgi:hypothetical protein